MSNPTTCTVITNAQGGRCGAPAVTTFVTRRGDTFAECVNHAVAPPTQEHAPVAVAAHPPTRTTHPFVLVRDGRIVGYACTDTGAVERRAQRLGAVIVAVQR